MTTQHFYTIGDPHVLVYVDPEMALTAWVHKNKTCKNTQLIAWTLENGEISHGLSGVTVDEDAEIFRKRTAIPYRIAELKRTLEESEKELESLKQ